MEKRMLRTQATVFILLLAISGFTPALAQFSGDGSGTEADPYIITDVVQLQEISNDLDAHYELGNDIDAAETAEWNDGEGFEPIEGHFTGIFDGNGFTIANLTIDRPDSAPVGLFAALGFDSKISNLGLEDINYTGDGGIGGIAGVSHGLIVDSYATGSITGTTPAIGGLVGNLNSAASILDSFAEVNVTGGQSWVGGLAGLVSGEIINSHAIGNVTGGGRDVGGLVGDNQGTITDSYATGNVDGDDNRVGGLVGRNHSVATITNSFASGNVNGLGNFIGGMVGRNGGVIINGSATGDVTGDEAVGGLVGNNRNSAEIATSYATGEVFAGGGSGMVGGLAGINGGFIENSYATGNISVEIGGFSGGLVGNNNGGEILNSYAAGIVDDTGFAGGLVGATDGEITSTHWNTEVNPELDAVGFGFDEESGSVSSSSAQMMQQSSFLDWNFDDIWIITEGATYPWLRENPQDPPPSPDAATGVDSDNVPVEFVLNQNYPNPFNPVTHIQFTLSERNDVILEIFNIIGQRVATLINNENLSAGHHNVTWDATDQMGRTVSSGVYLYRLEAGSFIETKRMLFLQ